MSRLLLAAAFAAVLYAAMRAGWIDGAAAIAIAAGFAVIAALGAGVALSVAMRQKQALAAFSSETSLALERLEKREDARHAELVSALSASERPASSGKPQPMDIPVFQSRAVSAHDGAAAGGAEFSPAPESAPLPRGAAKALRQALADGQIPVSLQPVFHLQSGEIAAFIARARLGESDLGGADDLPANADGAAFSQLLSTQAARISRQLLASDAARRPIICPLSAGFLQRDDLVGKLIAACAGHSGLAEDLIWEADAAQLLSDAQSQASLQRLGAAGHRLAFRGDAATLPRLPQALKRLTGHWLVRLPAAGRTTGAVGDLREGGRIVAGLDDGRDDFTSVLAELGIDHMTSLAHGPARLVKPVLSAQAEAADLAG